MHEISEPIQRSNIERVAGNQARPISKGPMAM
jgi:hypothetical protein